MNNTNNFFAVFLNIVLGFLFIGSLIFSYFFGNYGGISISELNDNYILKDNLSFKSLPSDIQKKYIDKDKLNLSSDVNKNIDNAFDEDGNLLVIESDSIDDIKKLTKSLQEKVVFLEQENIILSNDKDDLLKIVQHEKSKNNDEQKNLLSNNLEKINEAEQQHYENISQLTMKINDLQRENIRLSQQINGKNDISKIEIEELKNALDKQIKLNKQNESQALNDEKIKYNYLLEEKKSLQKKVLDLSEDLNSFKSDVVLKIGKKDQIIFALESKINNLMLEQNNLLTKNSQSALEMQRKNSTKLEEFNEIIKNNTAEKDLIKSQYIDKIDKLEKKYQQTIEAQNNELSTIKNTLKNEKDNNKLILENSEKLLLTKEKELQYTYKKEKNDFIKNINDKTTIIAELNKTIDNLKSNQTSLSLQLESKKLELSSFQDTILQLQDKIKSFDKNERNLDNEVDKRVMANEEKHNKNYKILNEKVALLEQNIQSNTSKNINVLSTLNSEKIELIKKINTLEKNYNDNQSEIKNLKDKLANTSKEKNLLALSENEKLAKIKQSFEDLQSLYSSQEQEYKNIIKQLKDELVQKDIALVDKKNDKEKLGKYVKEITNLKKLLKTAQTQSEKQEITANKTNKLVKIDSIECDDMNSGNFQISSTCKEKVTTFLSKYDENNFFEIIPIIGTGGFASLNLIKRKSKLGIEDSEIERLTKLANLGLGKDRAKEAGWLVREKFGDDAKISYTVYNIEAKNKRGFVIRVYR